ncbi:Alkyl sulfatase BDS1, metallo-beta-lactamase superfamily [Solimonas aquatica]|uniref:Alkyl sulfatase BDS1, metallo-beta-lactamase superfamily n=1 Tax=Solimonas aquatica TaxID=489703 RepID=A0A1H9JVP2_9GAMM|nr:alkyl sulfatase dimerization domain-containing protein [Solimonas aquatica]SEQ90872.1 Alkyl sulfatase BDS1, metallo-beta-lactamase superfamily [Solimonas aquatica]
MPRLSILLLLSLLAACERAPSKAASAVAAPEALRAHSEEFKPQLIEAAPGVYQAIGYGIANSIMIEGEDGLIIVDTMESAQAAQKVLALFRQRSDKPIKAVVYTHSHPDHIGGAAVFAPPGSGIPVYAQQDVARNMDKTAAELRAAITRRSLRMYGSYLPEGERLNLGIGGFLDLHADSQLATLRPTRTFDAQLEDTVAGVHFQLVHAPGETADQLYLWLPERGVLLCGDNFYRSFPNLYTIRGTSYRDPRLWAESLDRMRALKARYLVPSHTRPLSGEAAIAQALTDYRDAIRYVYDQSIRLINRGLTPDEIAAQLTLPAQLAASPYLQPFYGKPSWSAKSIFTGNLGWFSGDAAALQPLPPQAEAQHMLKLAGGAAAMDVQIQDALAAQDWQWVLQLSGYVLRVNAGNESARKARIAALRALGAAEANAPARDWYFSAARELAGEIKLPSREASPTPQMLAAMPLSIFFDGMAVNLHAEDCLDRVIRVAFEFEGSDARYTYIVRRGVSEVLPGIAPDAELQVRVSEQAFKETLAGLRNPALAVARDFSVVKGNKLEFVRFMQLFTPE